MMRVSSAEFIKDDGIPTDQAQSEAVAITRHGRGRRVVTLENFSDAEMVQIAAAEVPVEHAHLDEELAQAGLEPSGPVEG